MPLPSASSVATIGVVAETDNGTVMVVDDEPTIVEIVARYMERAGFETYQAHDGLEALRLADLHRPDLVVLDLMLPGIDGIEVMLQLQERPRQTTGVLPLPPP